MKEQILSEFREKFKNGVPRMLIHLGGVIEHPELESFLTQALERVEEEAEKRGRDKAVDYIRKNIVSIDTEAVDIPRLEVDIEEMDMLLEKARAQEQ